MKAKKKTSKLINWPPRLTPKRKRALALLQEWAANRIELDYGVGIGAAFTGTITQVQFDERNSSFLFRNDYGVHAVLSTDLYDRVEVNEIPGLPITVGFYRKNDPLSDGFSLRPKQKRSPQDAELTQVYALFRRWEQLDTELLVQTGDGMQISASRSKVKEFPNRFIFTVAETGVVHCILPERSTFIELQREGDKATVVLYNEKTGKNFWVTDLPESPEEIIDRFVAQTTRLQ